MVRFSTCGNAAWNSSSRCRHSSLGEIRSSVLAVIAKCRAAYIAAPAVSRAATSTTITGRRVLNATIRPISEVPGDKKRLEAGYDRTATLQGLRAERQTPHSAAMPRMDKIKKIRFE